MATVTDLRNSGSQVTNIATPIAEPFNAPEILTQYLRRFGNHYNVSQNSHLFRYLAVLCGEAGAGSLKKELLLPRLASQLENTQFLNLDRLYGDALALPRMSAEVYTVDPENQILTQTQWDDVKAKDAAYRERCLLWMRAIFEGPTSRGLELAAEAALGVDCDVFEQYRYLDNPGLFTNLSSLNIRNEFIIVPRTNTLTERDRRRFSRLVDKLKPVNTVGSLSLSTTIRTARTINGVASSSNKFYVKRLVTGRTDITWPTPNANDGTWVVAGTSTEAPTFAFMDRQEAVTYLDISSVVASSAHTGMFNTQQQNLFSNLAKSYDDFTYFPGSSAYAQNLAPLNIQQGWVNTSSGEAHDNIVANLYYALSYFAIEGVVPTTDPNLGQFWSSVENMAGTSESLIFNFGRLRPCNYISFELTPKPLDFIIEYDDGAGNWLPVTGKSTNTYSLSMTYLPSVENPWVTFEYGFNRVSTTRLRVSFTRRSEAFPLPSSESFPFSVDVRGLRIMHVMSLSTDFVTDTGTDILGNSYTTSFIEYTPSNTIDALATYWSSKPNPSRNAVESLYFDLRTGSHVGTQSYLDTLLGLDLTNRSQTDMESFRSDGQVVDEVFIDPVIPGADMHFYYSNDNTPTWDEKLWVPIPRNYICKKGYHPLPGPINVRFFKVEFTSLPAVPYQPVEYPAMPKVQYNVHPTWVTDYFDQVNPRDVPTTLMDIETVTFEPLDLFKKADDRMGQSFEQMRAELEKDHTPEIKTQVEELLSMQIDQSPQAKIEEKINYRSTVMWQNDIMRQLDPTRALSRIATKARGDFSDTGFNAELGLPTYLPPIQASVSNLNDIAEEKTRPTYWFPRLCRHGYKVIEGSLSSKIAFMVSIRTIEFHRRNYAATIDEPVYIETLDDIAHVSLNEFSLVNGAYYIGQ